ncbi:hypothetical protein PoB_005792100 [Plakobranchus ocellatus]|uniref:Uncharacterized protein n=1 Tax=Plakobranchus ocellatus TaxID=259542 RepID=A0AAV4CF63_9GAST|nr:hypothetical protein PoB_005792100 [Plakobranchus ocellatus]
MAGSDVARQQGNSVQCGRRQERTPSMGNWTCESRWQHRSRQAQPPGLGASRAGGQTSGTRQQCKRRQKCCKRRQAAGPGCASQDSDIS